MKKIILASLLIVMGVMVTALSAEITASNDNIKWKDVIFVDLRVPKSLAERRVNWTIQNLVKPNLENYNDGWQLTGYSRIYLGEDVQPARLWKLGIINAEFDYTEFKELGRDGLPNDHYRPHNGIIIGFFAGRLF